VTATDELADLAHHDPLGQHRRVRRPDLPERLMAVIERQAQPADPQGRRDPLRRPSPRRIRGQRLPGLLDPPPRLRQRQQRIRERSVGQVLIQCRGQLGGVAVADRRLHRQHDRHPSSQELGGDRPQHPLPFFTFGVTRTRSARLQAGRAA
jgi:hypothetical protein